MPLTPSFVTLGLVFFNEVSAFSLADVPCDHLLLWEVILTGAVPVHICGTAMQPATKGVGVT